MSTYTDVAVEYRHHTESAVLIHDGDKEIWLPRSTVQFNGHPGSTPRIFDGLNKGEAILLEVQEKIAASKGLI